MSSSINEHRILDSPSSFSSDDMQPSLLDSCSDDGMSSDEEELVDLLLTGCTDEEDDGVDYLPSQDSVSSQDSTDYSQTSSTDPADAHVMSWKDPSVLDKDDPDPKSFQFAPFKQPGLQLGLFLTRQINKSKTTCRPQQLFQPYEFISGDERILASKHQYSGIRQYCKDKPVKFDNSCYETNHIHVERRILILGLDGSGKSSFVHCFRKRSKNAPLVIHEEDVKASMNVKKIDMGNTSFYFIDLAGSADIRPFWEQVILVNRPDVIVWLIDSADELKFGESRAALHLFLGNDVTVGIPLLVVANKQDKKEALPPWALKEKLSLDQIGQNRKVEIIATQIPCGQTPSYERRGIFKAYKLMASM